MVRVKSRCCNCGEVTLSLDEIILVEHGDGEGTFYTFICEACGGAQAYAADGRFIDFMRMNGHEPVFLEHPIEGKQAQDAPPLTWDDLLDLHLMLEREA